MRVLHINGATTGGAAKAALRLHFAMLKNGIDSSFLTRRRGESCGDKCFSIPAWRGVVVAPLIRTFISKIFVRNASRIFSILTPGAGLRFNSLVRNADVIFLHWMQQGILGVSDLEWLVKNKKIFWILHDYNSITGGCCSIESCFSFLDYCRNCPVVNSRFGDVSARNLAIKRKIIKSARDLRFVPLSNVSFQYVTRRGALSVGRVLPPIPNVVPDSIFIPRDRVLSRRKLGLPVDKKLILFGAAGGIFNKFKGWHFLAECFEKSRLRDLPVEIVVFGCSRPDNWTFPAPVHFLGNIADEIVLSEIYSACDVFTVCSGDETFCQTLVESLSCGTPVIGFPVGVLPELSLSSVHCIRRGDYKKFSYAIEEAIAAPLPAEERRKLHSFVAQNYGEKKIVSKYIELVSNE